LLRAARQRKLWKQIAERRDERTNRILWAEYKKLEELGIVRRVSQAKLDKEEQQAQFIPRVFINVKLIEKEGSDPRPCLAACTLNDGVQDKKFKQSGDQECQATIRKNDRALGADIKKAFNHLRWKEEYAKVGSFYL
jgi:hypothetical protein